VLSFGPFRLRLAERTLFEAERPVRLGDRALELLIALVERPGELVRTEELMARVWPNTFVEPGNLKVHVAALRRALGDGRGGKRYLITVRRRGYRFMAPVREEQRPPSLLQAQATKQEPQFPIATILFSDVADSATLLQRIGDERALALFEAHHRLLSDAASVYGEAQVQSLGDGLTVAFPSAADAVRCAITIQQAAAQQAGEPLLLRVGLNVGEVLQPKTGSGYFGTSVLVARQLCAHAQPGQILCSQAVSHLLGGRVAFAFRELPELAVEVGTTKVRVCEVAYEAERVAALLARTPLVGRRSELARLERRLETARAGTGGLAFLVGEPGIGKTRLLEEFSGRARAAAAEVLSGRCFEGEFAPPFGAFVEAIATYAKERDAETLRSEISGFGGVLAKIVPELREYLPDLAEPVDLAPEEERPRLLDAVAQVLFALARKAPLVVILDDLHWAEAATLALLRYLGRFLRRYPVLLVGAYRDIELGRGHPLEGTLLALSRELDCETIALSGLDHGAVTEFLEALSKKDVPADFVEAITTETGGNPLFLREVLLHLLEEGKIERTAGRFTSRFSIEEMGIPAGVRQVIRQRLARLSKETNRLLAAASGCAGGWRFDVAAAAAGLKEREALDALDEALEGQLLRATREPEVYTFSHTLLRHTLYSELSPARKLRLHRRLAQEMERHHGEHSPEHAFEIAQQWHQSAALPGAEPGAAVCLIAADRAAQAAAYEEEAIAVRMALDLLPVDDRRRHRLLARLALALAWGVKPEEAVRVASEAGELLAVAEGRDAAADYLAEAANAVFSVNTSPLAWTLSSQGLHHIGDRRDFTWALLMHADLMRRMAEDLEFRGVPLVIPEMEEIHRIAIASPEWLRRAPDEIAVERLAKPRTRAELLALPYCSAIRLATEAGEYRRAVSEAAEYVARALAHGRLASAALGSSVFARAQLALGELSAAEEWQARAFALSERVGNPPFVAAQLAAAPFERIRVRGEGFSELFASSQALLQRPAPENYRWVYTAILAATAYVAAEAGRREIALRSAGAALPAIERAPGWEWNYTFIVFWTVAAYWEVGHAENAVLLERNLREKCLACDFRHMNTDTRLALAWTCALQGRFDEAVAWFAQARVELDAQGARPLRAITDFEEARMHARRGDREGALALLDAACGPFESIGMPGWLRRADELRRQLEG
jgi:DNA-binding winged helix-turn-helix (wHTH) protein